MGAQANCCKQPEGVIEENKFNTLGAANGTEGVVEKKDENQNNTQFNAEYVTYANPIYQTVDGTGKETTTGVDTNLYNQYFQRNNNQNLQEGENQEQEQEQEQQMQQQQVEQNDEQMDQQQVEPQYQQAEPQYQQAEQQYQQAEQQEEQQQGGEMQVAQDAAAGGAEIQQSQLLNQNNENMQQVQQGGYNFQPVQVFNTVKPVTYAGTTVAKTNVLSPVTQPISYDNNALTNIEGMIQGAQADLSAFTNVQTPEGVQYDNVQASQYGISDVQNSQFGTGEVAQYTNDQLLNQYVTGAQTTQYSQSYNYAAASNVNYAGAASSVTYAQPITSSTQSYQYAASYQLPTTTTTTANYASYNVQGRF